MKKYNRYPIYLPPIQDVFPLSQREIEILERSLLPSDKHIADELFISYHTVRSHIDSIKKKTGYNSRQLICYATKQGYIN